ncbi:MAG TPA: T9SS type A sorting domain-containing protein [Bacteroidales bacterium]|nr:T9SS type A sorting domain-containing protein [Bacteroidales bacterium]HPS17433.1 T9SS type A sorting domain-containing protein [Bacteroidales bacterium]
MKKIFLLLFIFIGFYSIAQRSSLQWLDAAFYGPVFSLNVQGNYAYIGSGSAFTVVDISNPQSPLIKGHCHTTDCITYVFPFGNVCYAGNNAMGIAVIDISNPSQPLVSDYLFPGEVPGYSPVIIGNTGYFPRGSSGITLMDLSIPLHPVPLSSWNQSGHDFSIDADNKDSIIFLTDRSGGIYRLKINSNSPATIDNYKISGWNFLECSTDEQKKFLYVTGYKTSALTNDTMKLLVFNIENSANFIPVGEFNYKVYSSPLDLKIKENHAYIASWSDGALVINVANPDSMYFERAIPSANQTNWIEIRDNLLYKADLSGGWNIYDISNLLNPQMISEIKNCGDTKDIFVNENYIYAAIDGHGVGIAEIKTDGKLEEKTLWEIPGGASGVFVKDTFLFVASGEKGIVIAGISNPLQPDSIVRIKHIGTNGPIKLMLKDNLLAAGENVGADGFLVIWDITNIALPVLKSYLQFANEPINNLDWYDNNIAVACWTPYQSKSMKIIDVSNPVSPNILGTYSCFSSDLKVFKKNDSTYAAVSIGSTVPLVANGLLILNITDPANIYQDYFFQSGIWGNMNAGVDIYNNYAITSEGGLQSQGQLRIFDISDPQNISQTNNIQIGSNTSNNTVITFIDRIYHSSGSPGAMSFLWNSVTGIFIENMNKNINIKVYPNPAVNEITIENAKGATIEIFSVNGKQVYKNIMNFNNEKIKLDDFKNGVYAWKAIFPNGDWQEGKIILY